MDRHADLYCQQLDRAAAKLQGKQDRIYFLHDNAKLHIAKSTREKLCSLSNYLEDPLSTRALATSHR